MRKLLLFLIIGMALGLSSCKKERPDAAQLASAAAKDYYGLLLKGDYQKFVAGVYQPNKIPDGYHKQLVMNAQMFMEQQKEEHRGIARVEVLSAHADTAHHVADVFLCLVYGDRSKEQVVVPMVEEKGTWKMR